MKLFLSTLALFAFFNVIAGFPETPQCGKVLLNENDKGVSSLEGQWPWHIGLYQRKSTNELDFICGGTLVSQRHVITAAHCATRKKSGQPVNENTLTVNLGKYRFKTSTEEVQVKLVSKIIVHPEYNATVFSRDLAILELREPVTFTNWVQPACLWPEDEKDLTNIVGKKGSLIGWGYVKAGEPRVEQLGFLEMPVVDQLTCIRSYPEFYSRFTSDYTYCAREKDASECNNESGSGMVFKKGNNWYLRGVASLFVARPNEYVCDPQHYVIFTDIAKFLPWIKETING